MEIIKKQYIVDENHETIAVQIDIQTFKQIENTLENDAFVQLMKETELEPALSLNDARQYYRQLEKAK